MSLQGPKLTVVFAHGKESGPWGTKITWLADTSRELGCPVESVNFSTTFSPDVRVAMLNEVLDDLKGPFVLVGSSMGAYVVTVASATYRPMAMLLMAPVVYLPGYAVQELTPCADHTAVVHGWHDQVVPVENVLRFCREHSLELHLLPDGHQLLECRSQLQSLFQRILQDCLWRLKSPLPG
ncbi:MAG: hypothetical protein R2864_09105 [Syntrophotaleaceae bacterium]